MKKVLIGSAVVALLMVYQNCSFDARHSGGVTDTLSLGKSCQDILKNAYKTTYYNAWFRNGNATQNCVPCHAGGGEAGPSRSFAHADFEQAFAAFSTIGRTRVQLNGVNPNHKPPHTGPQNQFIIDSAQSTWKAAEAAAATCNGSAEIVTVSKSAPANVYTSNPSDNAATAWPRINFDLDTELKDATLADKVHMTISLEMRRFMDNTKTPPVAIGYQFRNPTVTVKTVNGVTPTYRIVGISMMYNDAPYTYMTAYNLMDINVNSTTGVNLAPGSAFAAAPTPSLSVRNTDQFGIRFSAILDANGEPVTVPIGGGAGGGGGTTIPTRVTFADLNSANPVTGVFSRSCRNCHNANNASGSLDLTNYAASVAVASTIRARMNNAANPMPPGAILGNTDRAVVDVWIDGGTPQN